MNCYFIPAIGGILCSFWVNGLLKILQYCITQSAQFLEPTTLNLLGILERIPKVEIYATHLHSMPIFADESGN
jgi:hypothetical protein